MPAWSPQIAQQFIRLAALESRSFDQMKLQRLVYIAHGIRLAMSGHPLTGDRPEAWEFGPVYRRIADQYVVYGDRPIDDGGARTMPLEGIPQGQSDVSSNLDSIERDLIRQVYKTHGEYSAVQLSAFTRGGGSPWEFIFDRGTGKFRDIPHRLIGEQFAAFSDLLSK